MSQNLADPLEAPVDMVRELDGESAKSIAFTVLYGAESQTLISPKEVLDASYTVLQRSVSSAAGEAISKLAVRFAAGTDELAQLVRKDQDLTAEAESLDNTVIAFVSKPPAQRSAAMARTWSSG